MFNRIEQLFQEIRHLTWSKVLMVIVLLISGLLGYYFYYLINHINDLETKIEQTATALYEGSLQIPYEEVEPEIETYMTDLRYFTGADWTVFFGIHNGSFTGPFHVKKLSAITEAKKTGLESQLNNINSVPLSFFNYFSFFDTNKDTVVSQTTDYFLSVDKLQNIGLELRRSGVYNVIWTGVYLDNLVEPVGIIAIYYRKYTYGNLDTNMIEMHKSYLYNIKKQIEYEFRREISEHGEYKQLVE